jgi:AraC-like DNA-binding protein
LDLAKPALRFVEQSSDFVEELSGFHQAMGMSRDMQAEEWGTLGSLLNPAPGQLLDVLETPSAILRHAYYETGAEVGWHEHSAATLVYGVGGPCVERDSAGRECVKRRFSYHPVGYSHSLAYHAPTHVLAIELGTDIARRLPKQSRRLPATLYDRLWELFVRLSRTGADEWACDALDALVSEVVAFLSVELSPRLLAVLESLHTEWDRPLEPSRTARQFGVSPQLIRREFKRALGVTPSDYRRVIQLDYARGLLWGSRARVAEIAAQTAFSDQSHLCRVLKEHTQLSPLELRRAAPCLAKAFSEWQAQPIR